MYLNHPEPEGKYLSESTLASLKAKAAEFMDRSPGEVFFDHRFYQACVYGGYEAEGTTPYAEVSAADRAKYRECVLGWMLPAQPLPLAKSYAHVDIRVGGAKSRKKDGGWASYRQLWPASSDDNGVMSPTGTGRFDVSDVDITNIPALDCNHRIAGGKGCDRAERYSDLGVGGWVSPAFEWGKWYIQIKASANDDPRMAAARGTLLAKGFNADRLVLIPVKHTYQELFRWAVILDRFSRSAGNTLGISSAVVGGNTGRDDRYAYPLPEIPRQGLTEDGGVDWNTHRTTIVVRTQKLQETVDALPQLLGQLSIPVTAVGVVFMTSPDGPYGPSFPDVGAGVSAVANAAGESPWITIAIGGVAAALVLGGAAVVLRLVRRRRA